MQQGVPFSCSPGINSHPWTADKRFMRFAANRNPLQKESLLGPGARRHGRIRCEILQCGLGEVMDISASGMRVRHCGRRIVKEGKVLNLLLKALDRTLPVTVKVVWVKRQGFMRYSFGVEFVDMTPEQAASIASFARVVIDSRMLPDNA